MNIPTPPKTADIVEVTPERLEEAVKAIEKGDFDENDTRIAVAAMKTLAVIISFVATAGMTIARIRQYLGVEVKREKQAGPDDAGKPSEPDPPSPSNGERFEGDGAIDPSADEKSDKDQGANSGGGRDNHGRRGKDDFPDAEQRFFVHPDFDRPACTCPQCLEDRMCLVGAGGFIRFNGQPWLKMTRCNREIWRCGHCGAQFLAPLPEEIECDGGDRRVGYSAASMVALAKYLYGTPWKRQERFSSVIDLELSAQTQWEFSSSLGNAARPVYEYLPKLAALALRYLSDDTGARIIGLEQQEKIDRKSGKTVLRTGVHTSCIYSLLEDGRQIILYKTGIIHAGEFLDEILIHRPKGLPRPQHMSDGLAGNEPTVCEVIPGDCNAHARRKLEEKQTQWPAVWEYVKSVYKIVYKNEDHAKEAGLTPEERLELHRKKSLPFMKAMFVWMQSLLSAKEVSPNSGLGGIFEYFLTRELGLTAFCKYPGFPIDNNLCEQLLKIIAQLRKNAEYFRTLRGAGVADIIISLGVTAMYAGVNVFDYFNNLQRFKDEVARSPEDFLPWNYVEAVKRLTGTSPPARQAMEVTETEFIERQKTLHSDVVWGRRSPSQTGQKKGRPRNQDHQNTLTK